MCDTRGEDTLLQVARNEAALLQKLDCNLINKSIAFYEDLLINKTYLVLEHAGNKSLTDFVREQTGLDGNYSPPKEEIVQSLMRQLF